MSFKHIIFIIFLLKLFISGFFISPYFYETFLPFLKEFETHGYDAWVNNKFKYPYPPLLTLILYIFYKLGSLFGSTYIFNIIYHIPILAFDFGLFCFIKKLLPYSPKKIIFYYLLSPIVIYSSYIHSQHDIIPTFFIFAGSFYVSKKNFNKGFLILGIAIAIKWHTIIALPLFLIFAYRKHIEIKKLLKLTLLSVFPIVVTLIPFASPTKALSLFQIGESSLIFESFISIKDLKIYLLPLAYAILIVWSIRIKKYNTELFIGINAILFLLFIIIVYPTPGWFIWSLPFLIYSFSKYQKRKNELYLLYSALSLTYLVFFIFFYQHPLSGESTQYFISNKKVSNIVFTILVSLLLISTYLVYLSSVRNSILFKRSFSSFLIGIAGDSGSGKTTLLNSVKAILGTNSSTVLEGDGEHKWERGSKNWEETTHLDPKANFLHKQLSHLINLKKGLNTQRSNYNHKTGKFDQAQKVRSKDFIVIAGLHPFYLKGAQENIDFKIFIDTELNLRKNWKVVRDINERGHSKEKVLNQIEKRMEDSKKFIQPQREFADLVIIYSTDKKITSFEDSISPRNIKTSYLINHDINLEGLISLLERCDCKDIDHNYLDDLTKQSFSFNYENFNKSLIKNEFDDFFENLEIDDYTWEDGSNLINQIVILYCIKEKYIGLNNEGY